MSPFPAQVQFPRAEGPRDLPLGKLHSQLDQFGNPFRPFLDDRANDLLFAQAGARLQRVAHVQLE